MLQHECLCNVLDDFWFCSKVRILLHHDKIFCFSSKKRIILHNVPKRCTLYFTDFEFSHTGCPTKNVTLFWRAVAPLNFELGIKVGGVLESSGSQLFKTVPTFEF